MAKAREKPVKHTEVKGLVLLASALFLFLSVASFSYSAQSSNWLGMLGSIVAWGVQYLFGMTSFLWIGFLGWLGWKMLAGNTPEDIRWKTLYFVLFSLSIALLSNWVTEIGLPLPNWIQNKVYAESLQLDLPYPHRATRYNLGGVPAYFFLRDLPAFNLLQVLSHLGVFLTLSIAATASFLLFTEIQIVPFLRILPEKIRGFLESSEEAPAKESEGPPTLSTEEIESQLTKRYPLPIYSPQQKKEPVIRTSVDQEKKPPSRKKEASPAKAYTGDFTSYQLPPPSLLNTPKKIDHPSLKKELKKQADTLEESLLSFGIEAKVGDINCGPTITSFEVHPAVGVKVQKIKTLENDIALNLQAKSIRIIAPIPGKAAVGVEVPSLAPQEVSFKEMLIAYQQSPRKLSIPVLLGKAVNGENVLSDLAKMPHCIIAGATGSGKSVCINTIIMSIVMNARPDEIRLLMVDPKKVELTGYSNLPHLIAPVITEAHGAYAALNWLVKEMQTRYEILKQLGVRNSAAFNSRQINKELESSLSIPVPQRMSSIVCIIDEFADLMMTSSSDLETPVARIAQMARAVGIHLILATQRPSREVITGLIKANFPTRIAFKVASRINSQIILDDVGAETLLGNGDLLFLPPGSSHLIRAQGVYISDEEIHRVISFICDQTPPQYLIESFDKLRKEEFTEGGEEEGGRDALYEQARAIVMDTKTASTTFLQRKLKIGYARAASLMDELENKGIIGPQEGSKPRRILVSGSGKGEPREPESFE